MNLYATRQSDTQKKQYRWIVLQYVCTTPKPKHLKAGEHTYTNKPLLCRGMEALSYPPVWFLRLSYIHTAFRRTRERERKGEIIVKQKCDVPTMTDVAHHQG